MLLFAEKYFCKTLKVMLYITVGLKNIILKQIEQKTENKMV